MRPVNAEYQTTRMENIQTSHETQRLLESKIKSSLNFSHNFQTTNQSQPNLALRDPNRSQEFDPKKTWQEQLR